MQALIIHIWDYISFIFNNLIDQGWGALAGFLLGLSVTILRKVFSSIVRQMRHWLTSREIDYLENRSGGLKVLEYGPSILVSHDSIKSVNSRFILPCQENVALQLTDDPDFTGALSTAADVFGSNKLSRLGEILQIDGIEDKILPHIEKISQQFLAKEHGITFNSTLYGVRTFHRLRYGPYEQPRLSLTCYETDYFTFKVMDSFHREIFSTNKEKSLRSFQHDADINQRLYPFLASIGLNFILICEDKQLILTERSSNVDRFGLEGKPIYPSFNEALASRDLPHQSGFQHLPSIPLCFQRGLSEELGLSEFEVGAPVYRLVGFTDIGIGLGIYGYAATKLTSKEVISRWSGQDREFESARVFSVPLRRRRLNKVINDRFTGLNVVALLRALKVDFQL